ncbi:hypothetical protein FI667_g4118, partial [Globisporangium splendens]
MCSSTIAAVLMVAALFVWGQVRDGRAVDHALRASGSADLGLLLALLPRCTWTQEAHSNVEWEGLAYFLYTCVCVCADRQIPGFLLYHGGKMLLKYVFTPDASEVEDDAATLKKKEKAERKAQRPKFKRGY